jgi:hypothetical protein
MSGAKDLIVRPISAAEANVLVKRIHYSGKVVQNSQIHMGVFWNGRLEGAMQFGPSLDKRKLQGLVAGTRWNEFIELNRMAFDEALPRNSESRAIAVAMRILRKHAPHLKWVVSFADGAQCGDGTIYRASGFVLTGIRKNTQVWVAPGDARESRIALTDKTSTGQKRAAQHIVSRVTVTKGNDVLRGGGGASMAQYKAAGFEPIPGYQLRYLYFLDPSCRERLTVPVLPFSEIERVGAGMYRGKSTTTKTAITSDGDIMPIATTPRATSIANDAPDLPTGNEGGVTPTVALPPTSGKTPKGGRKHGRKE